MSDRKLIKFVRLLKENQEPISGEIIAKKLGISARTLRKEINNYRSLMKEYNLELKSKPKVGYQLIINDENLFFDFIQELLLQDSVSSQIPVYPEERIQYILNLLLSKNGYIKLSELEETLYVSKYTLTNDIREIRKRLLFFQLDIVSKPNYGIKICGSEMHRRSCMVQYFYNTESDMRIHTNLKYGKEKMIIEELLSIVLEKNKFRLTDIGYHNLVIHILIGVQRFQTISNQHIDFLDIDKDSKEYVIAQEIALAVGEKFSVEVPSIEIDYITVHLLGKSLLMDDANSYVLTPEIQNTLKITISKIKDIFGYNFSNDFELFSLLALHFQPMFHRIKYGLMIENLIIEQIVNENQEAFEIAIYASKVIEEITGYKVHINEVGYLSLHFQLALEKYDKSKTKKNVIIVCASGRGSSQIVLHKIKSKYKDQIDKIYVSDIFQLSKINQKQYDFILSTIPIEFKTDIPAIHIPYFIKEEDLLKISDIFNNSNESLSILDDFLKPKAYFTDIKGSDYKQLLREIVQRLKDNFNLPDDFYERLLERESIYPTEYGNMIALPHPNIPCLDETFLAITILSKPITWSTKKVKYIFMVCLKKDDKQNMEAFNEVMASLVLNSNALELLNSKMSFNEVKKSLTMYLSTQEQGNSEDAFDY